MFATLFTVALFVAPAIRGVLADFEVNTITLTQCQDAQVSWQQTQAPYNLLIVPGNDPCGEIVDDLGDHNDTSMTWKVNVPAGQSVMFSLEDANGDEAWSGAMVVQGSGDASCLPTNATSSSFSSAVATPATTLPAQSQVPSAPAAAGATPPANSGSGGAAVPVGAANAGHNPVPNSGFTTQRSVPVVGLSVAAAAILAIAL